MRRETKHSHSKKSRQSKLIIENGTKPQIEEDKANHYVFNGSESGNKTSIPNYVNNRLSISVCIYFKHTFSNKPIFFLILAIMQYMVKTENRWQCRACDFVSTSKNEANCKQNLKKHIRTSHSKSVKPT